MAAVVGALPLLTCPGRRQGSILYHGGDGLFYHMNNNRPNRRFAYLRCIHFNRESAPCSGSARALMCRQRLYPLKPHVGHGPSPLHPLVIQLRRRVVERVRGGDQNSFVTILQQEGQHFPPEVRGLVALPTMENHLNLIRGGMRPRTPRSLGVLGASLLEPHYEYLTRCQHVEGSMFAGMCGSMPDQTLSLVFISPEMQEFMQTRNTFFADGTERKMFSKPKGSQIFSITGVWGFHVIPMLRSIMIRRTTAAYLALFTFLMVLMPNCDPDFIKCDFEDGLVNAFRIIWPRAAVEGCLWHFAVAVYMKARKLGLYHLVKENDLFASIVRSVGALPLLPTNHIMDGLEALGWEAQEEGWMHELRDFFQYMDREWSNKVPILSVKGSSHRTNNAAESANRVFNKEVKVSRPNCFSVIRAFVVSNDKAVNDLRLLRAGLRPGRGRKLSALKNDTKIRDLTVQYDTGDITILEFLHRASRRLQNVFDKVFR